MEDTAQLGESAAVGMTAQLTDSFKWSCHTRVDKFDEDGNLYETLEVDGNALMYGGASNQWQTLLGNGTGTAGQALTYYNNANAAIGVGDSTTAAAPAQTNLQAGTNRLRKGMDSGFPQHSDGVVVASNSAVFRSTFGPTEANWVWNEWGVFNSATDATGRMLNRKQENLGTKAANTTWQITVTLTLN